MEDYLHYWGKARPEDAAFPGPSALCHLLAWHALDVAAVGAAFLRQSPRLLNFWAEQLGIPEPEKLIRWISFWLALHDLGKFSLSFQAQRLDLMAALQGQAPASAGLAGVRHDSLGMWAWSAWLADRAESERWFAPNAELSYGFEHWARAVTGHHGQPPVANPANLPRHFRAQDQAAVLSFVNAMRTLLLPPGSTDWLKAQDAASFEQTSQRLSWWLAGLAVLADWIGSNANHFAYQADPRQPVESYWRYAQAVAEQELAETGALPAAPLPEQPFGALFPQIASPSPLQQWASSVAIPAAPQIHMLEDVTGAGKTEAAVMLAHRLMAAGLADGFFIGLPTMATANAMYGRIAQTIPWLFHGHPSLVLAHGRKDLVEDFAASVLKPGVEEQDLAQTDETATSRCTRWLADHNKRALLAPAGVGTIDQALLGALQSKHQSLRLLGLFGKVLIVDEVHACDAYMQRTLEALLEFHASAGGSAILLSATLPRRMKQALLNAYARGTTRVPSGASATAPRLSASNYPLTTSWRAPVEGELANAGRESLRESPTETRPAVQRTVQTHYEPDLAAVMARIVSVLNQGLCVAWLRNTISDALQAQAALSAWVPAEQITLFHARFTLGDRLDAEAKVLALFGPQSGAVQRRGQLLIATQVAEQSLDIDADFLVTDLAPIDRLIQRAGRLRRHPRSASGERLPAGQADERGEPCLWVHGPAWCEQPGAAWFKQSLPKAAHVYPDHGQLWLSAQQLQKGAFTMPDDARGLVEAVYGDEAEVPAGLQASSLRADGQAHADRSLAQLGSVKLAGGYQRGGTDWLADSVAPSRLGEASVEVVLARWEGGRVQPWRADKAHHAWAYSTVRLARRLLDAPLEPSDPARQQALAAARASMPGGGQWAVLLVLEELAGHFEAEAWTLASDHRPAQCLRWRYDAAQGLVAVAPSMSDKLPLADAAGRQPA